VYYFGVDKDMKELLFVNSINGAVLMVSMTEVETILKVALLAVSLVWTVVRIVKAVNEKDKDDKKS
jgi:hypothetical protein